MSEGNPRLHSPFRFYWQIVVLVFLFAAGRRISLVVFNREANDNDYEMVKLILEGRRSFLVLTKHHVVEIRIALNANWFTEFSRIQLRRACSFVRNQ